MAVTNSWGLRNATPLAQLRPQQLCSDSSSSSSSSSAKKEINLNFVCSILNRPISIKARNLNLSCRCSSSSSSEWDWTRWSRRFSEIEETENTASVLKIQLKDAIEKEDFEEAVKLKKSIEEATSEDSIAEIMSLLKNAIDEERYHDASKLCQVTKKNLIGWWVGCSKDFDDPFGRVIRITPGVGRFVAKSYTPRQLVTGSSGTPLFEIFVVKDADQEYITQVVCFKRAKGSSTDSSSPSKVTEDSPTPNSENSSTSDILGNEEDEPDKDEEVKSVNIKDTSEEGIKGVLNFLKDKIPGLKVKVMNVNVSDELLEDSESVEQLLQENENEKKSSAETSEDETDILEEIHPEGIQLKGGANTRDEIKTMALKLFIGGESHNKKDTNFKDERVRYPAEIKDVERDSFVLHIPKRNEDFVTVENTVPKVNIEDVAAKEISELMPRDVAHAFWSVDKPRSRVAKDVREIIKLAVSQAQKHNRLSKNTTFKRIPPSEDNLDPLEGLFVGSFGPYGPEVVQLTRKFGHWHVTDDKDDLEFFEYVEAVKLTGDLNVPVGQVTFRAKIGKGNRISNRGRYPEELGVVSSYKGQGRIAEVGFRNPQWVDGELLQLRGKGMGPHIRGADLGFLYVVPEQSFLVLFNRLKLPE